MTQDTMPHKHSPTTDQKCYPKDLLYRTKYFSQASELDKVLDSELHPLSVPRPTHFPARVVWEVFASGGFDLDSQQDFFIASVQFKG
jgi:hypothetical protein